MDNLVVEVKNLTKKFGPPTGGFTAVDNISFSIKEGEIVGLLGPNGAGKTTTIRIMLTFITPDAGDIYVFGKKLFQYREEILKRVNVTFVNNTFGGRLSVVEILKFFGMLYEVRDIDEKIEELLTKFGINNLRNKKIRELSSGELSRVALCKAFINSPKVLYLDEPTASLDPDMADQTRKLLLEMKEQYGLTILYTSHNMHEVEEVCDRIIFLHKGKIVAAGTPLEITQKFLKEDSKEPALREVFIRISRGEAYELE